MDVSIRFLEEEDAKISYIWRNDSVIWKYTGSKPTKFITYEIENDWIKRVLKRKNEIRFAICIGSEGEYVGNVQLTNITEIDAEFHIFIGNKNFQNKGIGTKATSLILSYAMKDLKLKAVYLFVNKHNISAIKSYNKCGFFEVERDNDQLKLIINLNK